VKRFLSELKRREVIKPTVAYIGLSWVVLQVVGVLVGITDMHPLFGPSALLLLVCGFPVSLYLSWHFDFSLENGITRTPNLDKERNPSIQPFGLWNWTGLVVIAMVSTFVGYQFLNSIVEKQLAEAEGLKTVKIADSIAVMPFVDQSQDLDQAYLAVGLSEEITSLLGSTDGFTVSASRSSQILSERGLTPVDIGRRLGVDTVLTGSVRATGSRLKIRVELLDTENGRALWSESFLRELKDVFELETEISRAVVNLLQDRFIEAGELTSLSNTQSVDAYVMYLKGREEYRKQTTESMKAARKLFEQAIALDPEYAMAYVALADTIALLSDGPSFFGVLESDIAATLAEQNLEKALVREPEIAQIYAVMGLVQALRGEFDESIGAFDKSLELNPSLAIAYMWKSNSLLALQRFEEAIVAQQKAKDLDPLFITNAHNLGALLVWQGRFKEAEAVFIDLKDDYPNSVLPHQGLASLYFDQGNYVEAIKYFQKAMSLTPENEAIKQRLHDLLVQLGLVEILKNQTSDPSYDATILIFEEKFEALFEMMDFAVSANPDDYWTAFEAGWYYAMFGDKQKALALLTTNYELLDDADKYMMPFCSPAIEVVWAKQALGDNISAQESLTECQGAFENDLNSNKISWGFYYLGARIHALKGDKIKALMYLKKAVDNGWREWWTKSDPLLKSLHEEAKYKELIIFIESDLARQREEVRSLFEKQ
jgi:TolB-like protein/Tfp pilus assembly protein PilF